MFLKKEVGLVEHGSGIVIRGLVVMFLV